MTTEADYKPGLEDVPAAKSAVSFLDGKKAVLEYRGIPVEVLAKESSFEEVSWLLIKGDLVKHQRLTIEKAWIPEHRRRRSASPPGSGMTIKFAEGASFR